MFSPDGSTACTIFVQQFFFVHEKVLRNCPATATPSKNNDNLPLLRHLKFARVWTQSSAKLSFPAFSKIYWARPGLLRKKSFSERNCHFVERIHNIHGVLQTFLDLLLSDSIFCFYALNEKYNWNVLAIYLMVKGHTNPTRILLLRPLRFNILTVK